MVWALMSLASCFQRSQTSGVASATRSRRATSNPEATRSRARRSLGLLMAAFDAAVKSCVFISANRVRFLLGLVVQNLGQVADLDARVLAVQSAADVHQAAHIAGHQSIGAAGLDVGDLVGHHSFGDMGELH